MARAAAAGSAACHTGRPTTIWSAPACTAAPGVEMRFWSSVALNAGRYSGRPVPAHMKLEGVTREDFGEWLGLFRLTLEDIAPGAETVDYFMVRAERIAQSLQLAMFGLESLEKS